MKLSAILLLVFSALTINAQKNKNLVYCGIKPVTANELTEPNQDILPSLTGKTKKTESVIVDLKQKPGAQILLNDSSKTSTTVRFRCGYRINTDPEPLFVIDGIPYEAKTLKDINPNDIENIEVLKSPAANVLFGCRAQHGVIIITTKKAYEKTFTIKDARERIGVAYATITATHHKTGKSCSFSANETGTVQTDMLRTREYDLTISSIGYKTKKISLKETVANRYEILLEREINELEEVVVTAPNIIRCRRTISCGYETMFVGKVPGMNVTIENSSVNKEDVLKPSLKLYPNPVMPAGTIHLSFANMKPGTYHIRLINAAGQLFYSTQKQITAKSEMEQIQLNNRIAAGVYIVQVSDEQNQLVQSSRVIVQK